jgi:hypothetical protein
MKTLAHNYHWWSPLLVKVCLANAVLTLFVIPGGYAQGALAPAASPAVARANASASASVAQFVTQLAPGLDLITIFGFVAGCVMVIGGFLNARRDDNWKMTVIHGLGVAGSVALLKALFGLFTGPNAAFSFTGFF